MPLLFWVPSHHMTLSVACAPNAHVCITPLAGSTRPKGVSRAFLATCTGMCLTRWQLDFEPWRGEIEACFCDLFLLVRSAHGGEKQSGAVVAHMHACAWSRESCWPAGSSASLFVLASRACYFDASHLHQCGADIGRSLGKRGGR